jgi:hypothetical protein
MKVLAVALARDGVAYACGYSQLRAQLLPTD